MNNLRRLEELALNSSAPPGQLVYDGWLLRLLPGQAKRARSVNAVYPSTRPLEEKIAYSERVYRDRGLPAIFRITPFSEPSTLDAQLETLGYQRFDTTAVESAVLDPAQFKNADAQVLELPEWVEAVGELRSTPQHERAAHLARLAGLPLRICALAVKQRGQVIAAGLTVIEDGCAGLFDIVTHADTRRKGHARLVVASLLQAAWKLGARNAYLQVKSDNKPARGLYKQFGFTERYLYWYRGRPGEQH